LAEYCLPFVKVGGSFVPMKSAKAQDEISDAKKAIHMLGGQISKVDSFDLLDCGERTIINVKKISSTPAKYPRPSAKIAKNPIK
jgi:16S rRNA G527 N7-methylase RsmG